MPETDKLPEDKLSKIPSTIELNVGENRSILQLVKEGADPSVLEIRQDDPTVERIQEQAAMHLAMENWWARPELLEQLGEVKEKLEMKMGSHKINIYNFWQPLSKKQLDELQQALLKVGAYIPQAVYGLEDIVISGVQKDNDKSGEPTNGDWVTLYSYKAFRLYPAAFEQRNSRVTPKTTHLTSTVTHELGHSIGTAFGNEWRKEFDWELISLEDGKPRVLPGGWQSWEVCHQPERCITDYARSDAGEDICESLVAYIYDPEKLDQAKRELLMRTFPLSERLDGQEVTIKPAPDKDIPKLPDVILFTVKPQLVRVVKG